MTNKAFSDNKAFSEQNALSWQEWDALDATALASQVANGELTPQELASQAAEAVNRVNPQINAVLEVFEDVVSDPTKDGINPQGAFFGVPMLMKDALSGMKGRRNEWGAGFMKGVIQPEDAPLTTNLRQAGFNLIGRTSLPAMGSAGVSDSLLHGVTRNPWNLARTPSGSSGGSAAAVAAGIVPIASASDGGGSTRSPANYTGLIGLKPTRGRLPLPPGFNEYNVHFAVEGVLTRTVRDTAAAFDAMARHRPGGSYIPIPDPTMPYARVIKQQSGQLRIALSLGDCGRGGTIDPEVAAAVNATAERLSALGHLVEVVTTDGICDWNALWAATSVTWTGGAQFWPEWAELVGSEINEQTLEPLYRHLIEAGKRYGLKDFHHAKDANDIYTRQFGELFQKYDLWLTPTEYHTAPLCGPESPDSPLYPCNSPDQAAAFIERMSDAGRFMIPANEAGFPAISVPAAIDSNGVPIGVQLSASWCREDLLLQVAAQLEAAYPEAFNQRPPLTVVSE